MYGRKRYMALVLLLTLFLSVGVAWGSGGTQLLRYVIGGGGGMLQSGTTTVHGVVGQPAVGRMSQGNYEVCTGFWCLPQSYELYLPLVLSDG